MASQSYNAAVDLVDRHIAEGRSGKVAFIDRNGPTTYGELADRVGLSRSALAQRFGDLLGQPPMQYLTRWRLVLAAAALRSGNRVIALVAEESGYESESAFNRAFKREFGMPPAAWRRQGPRNSGGAASSGGIIRS